MQGFNHCQTSPELVNTGAVLWHMCQIQGLKPATEKKTWAHAYILRLKAHYNPKANTGEKEIKLAIPQVNHDVVSGLTILSYGDNKIPL